MAETTSILTVLHNNIKADVRIPNETIQLFVDILIEGLVAQIADRYTLKENLITNVDNPDGYKVSTINHQCISSILLDKAEPVVRKYYQISTPTEINTQLSLYLIRKLHDEKIFMAACNNDLVSKVDEAEIDIEDMLEYDYDQTPHLSQASYDITQDILLSYARKYNI